MKILTAIALCICAQIGVAAVDVRSPSGEIALAIEVDGFGAPTYSVSFRGETVVGTSRLGLRFRTQAGLDAPFEIGETESGSHSSQWEQPWGERHVVDDRHNELLVEFKAKDTPARKFYLRARAFDDGVGFRYEVPREQGYERVDIVDELTEFSSATDATAWWIPARRWNRYEYLYQTTPLADVQRAHTPLTMRLESGVHLSIHEAALVDYAGMSLDQTRPGTLEADLAPWSDGIRVKTETPFVTPWRTIQISADAAGLLNSNLILNLNEPNALGDVSWVEPTKYIGIWWAMHIRTRTWSSGDQHGATTKETMEYMDFAAQHGFGGVLVEGWNIGWDGDWFYNGDLFRFTEPYPDFDLEAVTKYGAAKGVRLIGHHETSGNVTNYENQMAAALDLYKSVGVNAIKTGYVADAGGIKRVDENGVAHYEFHDGQFMVKHYEHVVKEAAKRKISINAHEPIKDTGLRRTYPNFVSREGARGQEFNAWGDPGNPPEHLVILPYTRMLAGPMDFTPGIFDLTFHGPDAKNRVQTTLAKQLALYVVIYSPLQMAADLPENYSKRPDALQFIVDVPVDWEESIGVAGEVGDFVVLARKERGGDDWYIGAVTDEVARDLTIGLEYLDHGVSYQATVYRDGDGAHWQNDPYSLTIDTREVDREGQLAVKLAAGGGVAVRLTPIRESD